MHARTTMIRTSHKGRNDSPLTDLMEDRKTRTAGSHTQEGKGKEDRPDKIRPDTAPIKRGE